MAAAVSAAGRSMGTSAVRCAHGGVAGKVLAADVPGELGVKDLVVKGLDALSAREQVAGDSAAACARSDPQNAGALPAAPQPAPVNDPVVPVACLRLWRKPGDPRCGQGIQPGPKMIDAHALITKPVPVMTV
jgi:hypothetical protein